MVDIETMTRTTGIERCPEDEEEDDLASLGEDESESHDEEEDEETVLTSSGAANRESELKIARHEDRAVWMLRILVAAVLVIVAVVICVVAYTQGRQSEQQDFQQAFAELGGKLVSGFEDTVISRIGTVNGFSMDLTSAVNDNPNLSWPFYTPPDFARRASNVAQIASLTQLFLLPKVSTEQKLDWEVYVQANKGWIQESVAYQEGISPEEVPPIQVAPFLFKTIGGGKVMPDMDDGPYFPVWTAHPVARNQTFTNLNPYAKQSRGHVKIEAALKSKTMAFSSSMDFLEMPPEQRQQHYLWNQIKATFPDYIGEPYFQWYYPVHDSFDEERKEIAALLLGTQLWHTYFENILPHGTKEIVVILENKCDQVYTFKVEGPTVQVLTGRDTHDSKYDPMELGTTVDSIFGVDESTVTAEDINDGNCHYSIKVYPSQEFEQNYFTNAPMLYTIALAGVFLFTCMVFIIYDCMVERRQKIVMKSAQQSGKLVSSLFPEAVTKQLYEEEDAKTNKAKGNESALWLNSNNNNSNGNDNASTAPGGEGLTAKQAIANLYPETTIFFCDLAGFTKWSSTRTPTEVFELLESLYGAFDAIAAKYNVFKVETIGDCYVAVTGLPEPELLHAVIMVKFARSCMSKLHVVTAALADKLGEDTQGLEMRVGLHSGPVTAGVLRGKKARFQLFGDSVNTASRMESNGMKGRIHVSEATANELRLHKMERWLTLREDKITAKGKGEMTTYWVNPKSSGSTKSGSSLISRMTSESVFSNDGFGGDRDGALISVHSATMEYVDGMEALVEV